MQIVQTIDRTPFDYQKISVATDAISRLDETNREIAKAVFITIEDNSIGYRIDSGNTDANDGHLITTNQNIYLVDPSSIRQFRAIASGGAATLIVTFYR